jgi:hypothetical protein
MQVISVTPYIKEQTINCGLGWYGLILSVLDDVSEYNRENQDKQCKISRFEAKSGVLNIVKQSQFPESLEKVIDRAQESSKYICEHCGLIKENKKCCDGHNIKADNELIDYMDRQLIYCGYGWYGLILPILAKIKQFNEKNPDNTLNILSFEEKWGSLKFVRSSLYPDFFENMLVNAKEASGRICENCGCIGELKEFSDGWLRTLCPECSKEEEICINNKRNEWIKEKQERLKKKFNINEDT